MAAKRLWLPLGRRCDVGEPGRLAAPTLALCGRHCREARRGYRRLLYRPSFPSDLPPALRQHAEVMRHAAPEESPLKATWTIHSTRRLHDVVPELCGKGAVQEIVANVVYHALMAVDCKDVREAHRRADNFRSDFFTACSNLFEVHHIHQGAENIFGVLSDDRLTEVSPKMRTFRKQRLRMLVLETMEEWLTSHRESLAQLDPHKVFEVLGPRDFLKLVPRLHFSIRALPPEAVEVLFHHVTQRPDLFDMVRVTASLMPVKGVKEPLGGSTWTVRRVLSIIEARQNLHSLRFLLSGLDPPELVIEVLRALRERDYDTGLVRERWAFFASVELEADVRAGRALMPPVPNMWPLVQPPPPPMLPLRPVEPVDQVTGVVMRQRLWVTDGELRPFHFGFGTPQPLAQLAPPSPLRDTPWPQLAFDPSSALATDTAGRGLPLVPEESALPSAVNAYHAAAGWYNEMDSLQLWTGGSSSGSAATCDELPSHASLPLDAIHFVDSAQSLSHVLTFLQEAQPAFVAIDLEWSDPWPVSIIQVALPTRVFLLDALHRTELYMSVLHMLMDWLLKQERITKLFFGFPHDLIRLNMLFGPYGKHFSDSDHIASIVDLYMQRVRHVEVWQPRPEDTPLGREEVLGAALAAEDWDTVCQLSSTIPAHPPWEHRAQRTFLIGGHHSLAGMVQRYLGLSFDKSLRRSNWNFRPLSASQVVYAATDAHILLLLEAAMRRDGAWPQRLFGASPRGRNGPQPAWWRPARPLAADDLTDIGE